MMSVGGIVEMTSREGEAKAVVLLAEDDEINQQIVRHLLSDFPFIELVVAGDGKVALEAAISQRFDLMIFDRNMPLITGDRVIRHLKAARTINMSTPMIQFTADADYARTTVGYGDHADAVIPKPIQGDVFRKTVLRLLGR
ncbi:MAG: response regulator [Pseudotabrizicola sp.]|uniref:response regulator n=1 Tax=Pseudotabrizicola sp. TaxID=2939647 RepID=UPI00271BC253|nr:response regulator [Pseudotabrizicola sp.]MDO8884135.1 response regulator [Pseudotabrizicola sp.]MDP2080052.1 response regulator [Pseudotabrizicola sp.]MDZ7575498.1 response regulator [Pseudotabrizicola sp.]